MVYHYLVIHLQVKVSLLTISLLKRKQQKQFQKKILKSKIYQRNVALNLNPNKTFYIGLGDLITLEYFILLIIFFFNYMIILFSNKIHYIQTNYFIRAQFYYRTIEYLL